MSRLLVVSHPSVVSENQRVYAQLHGLDWDLTLVVPARWRHEYASRPFVPIPLPELAGRMRRVGVVFEGRPARHFYLGRLGRLIDWAKPEVAFLEEETFSVSALQWGWALRRRGIPFGVQADENLERTLPPAVVRMRTWVLGNAAFVVPRSPRAADLVRSWGAGGLITLVPHAVPRWDAPPRRAQEVFTIGYAGRLVPEKGVFDLLAAAARLAAPVRLLLVGNGPVRERLERAGLPNGKLEIRTGVTHEAMPTVYAEMDVLVLPSRTTARWAEQFGRVLVEALQCGVPVVGSDSGEIPWVIESTRGGVLYPEGDVDALTDALERLRANPAEREALAHTGAEAVRRLFGEEASARALDSALRVAAGRPFDDS